MSKQRRSNARGCLLALVVAIGFLVVTAVGQIAAAHPDAALVFLLILLPSVIIGVTIVVVLDNLRHMRVRRLSREKLEWIVQFSDRLLIDTNIWMNAEYHRGLRQLANRAAAHNGGLVILGPEFEEITRLKDSAPRHPNRRWSGRRRRNRNVNAVGESEAESDKPAKAREALRLIEQLLRDKQLKIERPSVERVNRAFFDAVAVRLIQKDLEQGRRVCLITDDRELRIRATTVNPTDRLAVFEGAQVFAVKTP